MLEWNHFNWTDHTYVQMDQSRTVGSVAYYQCVAEDYMEGEDDSTVKTFSGNVTCADDGGSLAWKPEVHLPCRCKKLFHFLFKKQN